MRSSLRRVAVAVVASVSTLLAMATPAEAHLPVILTEANTANALAVSPYVPDGTVSFAFYGWLNRPRDTRAVRIHLDAGQRFFVQVLIPDLAPENTLRRGHLPQLAVVKPDGSIRVVPSTQRVAFAEPFTQTNYLILSETVEPAVSGTYSLILTGRAATRFVVASGDVDQFGAAIQNATIAGIPDVLSWYANATPPA